MNPLSSQTSTYTETKPTKGVRDLPLQADITCRGGKVSGIRLYVGPQQITQGDLYADELEWLNRKIAEYGRPSAVGG